MLLSNFKDMVSIIAVIGRSRELGCDNRLLWDLPEDMARFKRITGGHPVIMGRRTFESIGKPLPGRVNIIVTRKPDYIVKGATVVDSLDKAWEAAQTQSDEIFVIGGASIYEQALPYCGKLYLTVVDDEPRADTYFPAYKDSFRKVIRRESGEDNGFKYEFWELAP